MNTNYLSQVHEGMKVFDRLQHEIGKVDFVKFSEDDPETPEIEANEPPHDNRAQTLVDAVAEVFDPADLPDEIRDRLMQDGFVRIDSAGLFASDRYVTPDQIMSVSGDAVTLNVSREELVKRH